MSGTHLLALAIALLSQTAHVQVTAWQLGAASGQSTRTGTVAVAY